MNRMIYGTAGLILGILAVITGTYAILMQSVSVACGYLLLSMLCGVFITRFFCSKCPVKRTCVHILPGYMVRMWQEKSGPYTSAEILITCLLFAIIILPPQIFLLASPGLFIQFWICMVLAAVFSNRFLCPCCGNRFCPFCGKQ